MDLTSPLPLPDTGDGSRQQILRAAEHMVLEQGYGSVTMTELASRAKVSRATLYRYYSTKEQVYSDLTNHWAIAFVDRLERARPKGDTVGERVRWVVEVTAEACRTHPDMVSAHIATLVSDVSKVQSKHPQLKRLLPEIIGLCLGEHKVPNLMLVELNMMHLLVSNALLLNAGKITQQEMVDSMCAITQMLLGEAWDWP